MQSPPPFEERTLRLSLDSASLEYQYYECAKHFLWFCSENKLTKEVYDLTDPAVRKRLIDMGFVATVREKP